jgi:CheY-like chemotaxis protein
MALALIASPRDLDVELGRTVLGRHGFERQLATVSEQAHALALARQPDVVLVDLCLAGAVDLVARLRESPATRGLSIVGLSSSSADPREAALLKAGANAVLRLPADAGWDERLMRYVTVPTRKATRFPVSFRLRAGPASVPASGLNVSIHGLLLETWAPLELMQDVELLFRLADEAPLLRARGRVVRRGAPRQFGVEFTELDEPVRRAIESFVRAA